MSTLSDYFLASSQSVAGLELMEISHPNFTKTYRVVRNPVDPNDLTGVTVDLDDDETGVRFDYWPARFQGQGARDDLDYKITINLGDVGEVLPLEIDAVASANGILTKPAIRYWIFRSDDLSAPIFGPVVLEAASINFDGTISTIEAQAPTLNTNKTGERYKIERFPMLRGFVK